MIYPKAPFCPMNDGNMDDRNRNQQGGMNNRTPDNMGDRNRNQQGDMNNRTPDNMGDRNRNRQGGMNNRTPDNMGDRNRNQQGDMNNRTPDNMGDRNRNQQGGMNNRTPDKMYGGNRQNGNIPIWDGINPNGDSGNLNRNELMRIINELGFAVTDLNLFLDTHPNDEEALKMFTMLSAALKSYKHDYTQKFGPLYATDSTDETPFDWVDSENKWPWQA